MAEPNNSVNKNDKKENDNTDAEDVEQMLTVVIRRRTTVPAKCMAFHKQKAGYEINRIENAKIKFQDNDQKDKLKRRIQELKRLKNVHFSLDDLHDAEKRYMKCHNKMKQINNYLKKRKEFLKECTNLNS